MCTTARSALSATNGERSVTSSARVGSTSLPRGSRKVMSTDWMALTRAKRRSPTAARTASSTSASATAAKLIVVPSGNASAGPLTTTSIRVAPSRPASVPAKRTAPDALICAAMGSSVVLVTASRKQPGPWTCSSRTSSMPQASTSIVS